MGDLNRCSQVNKIINQGKKDHGVLFAGGVLIMLLSLYNIKNTTQMSVLNDEFGYWANAAYFYGYDWSGVSFMSPYYSWGYSILLMPLFLTKNPIIRYQSALVINAVLYLGSYLISYACIRRIYPSLKQYISIFICIAAALYSNNLLQANLAWGEGLLYLLFWAIFYVLLLIKEKPLKRYFILLAFLSGYMYAVHQRSVGVVISVCLVLLILKWKHKITLKELAYFFLTLLMGLLFHTMIKSGIQEALWNAPDAMRVGVNEYSGQMYKLKVIFSDGEMFMFAVKGFCAKVFYLCASTCMLFVWGVIVFSKEILITFRRRMQISAESLFCILSVLTTLGINTIFNVRTYRIDAILYGRYTEFVIGPFLLMGISSLFRNKKLSKKTIGFSVGVFLLLGMFIKGYIHQGSDYLATMSVGTSLFYNKELDEFAVRYAFGIPVLLGIIFILLSRAKKKYVSCLGVIPIVIFWSVSSNNVLKNTVNIWQEGVSELCNISSVIEANDKDIPVYFVYNPDMEGVNWSVERIQYQLEDREIQHITYEEANQLEEDCFIIHLLEYGFDMNKYKVAATGDYYYLFVPIEFDYKGLEE